MTLGSARLAIDCAAVSEAIARALSVQVTRTLRRKGLVVGLSGGIDSAVVAALATRALGPERVLALLMPERDSSPLSTELGFMMARHLGVEAVVEDIGPALDAIGCYARQDEAVRTAVPEYDAARGWRFKLTLPSLLDGDRLSVFQLTAKGPNGEERTTRLAPSAYRQLVAATNFKQRLRKTTEYYHADRLGYAVAGTPNRLEYDQGFFVKNGDGAADVKPIAHLYKTQVYALAEHLGVPEVIRSRPPTTDTFSLEQTQEEFYFALPYAHMDVCLHAKNEGVPEEDVARELGLEVAQVTRVYKDIAAKRRATRYLHALPLLVAPVPELDALDAKGA